MGRPRNRAFPVNVHQPSLSETPACALPAAPKPSDDLSIINEVWHTAEQSKLCSLCSKVDFKKIFAIPSSELGPDGLAVTDHVKDIDPACSLCALILSLDPPELREFGNFDMLRDGYHLRAFDSLKILRAQRTPRRVSSNPSVVLAAVPGEAERRYNHTRRG